MLNMLGGDGQDLVYIHYIFLPCAFPTFPEPDLKLAYNAK
jgi:hypothetical protein